MQTIEDVDPEFAELIKQVVNKKLPAKIFNTKVFEVTDKGLKEVTLDAGRNDPCPCGSGKKFKKCCGSLE